MEVDDGGVLGAGNLDGVELAVGGVVGERVLGDEGRGDCALDKTHKADVFFGAAGGASTIGEHELPEGGAAAIGDDAEGDA